MVPTMTDSALPSRPRLWSAVDDQPGPRIRSLATTMSLSETAMAQRIWAMVGVMVDQGFSSDMLHRVFPESSLLNVEPWRRRSACVGALEGSPEVALVHHALDHLHVVAQEGALPPLPARKASHAPPADWRTVFSRSTLGVDVFFVRGTHRSHSGVKSFARRKEHPHFRSIIDVCERYDLVRSSLSNRFARQRLELLGLCRVSRRRDLEQGGQLFVRAPRSVDLRARGSELPVRRVGLDTTCAVQNSTQAPRPLIGTSWAVY